MTTWKPTREQSQFIEGYAEALDSGDAALFGGAGLSRAPGHVDWRGLLREIAVDPELDIDRESDLVASKRQREIWTTESERWVISRVIFGKNA
uniref:Uncharacterized protein n=1 Tax=Candidatus Kentrum eta TaxID=2126337 RepID=A0A450UU82_9GAMM|nr:MAG: hypothetical protein BECKH772A_GA0070896_100838 [Candidatus Kentron sp. H]VFJ96045.1 MAG: hypothetical protein BECKH772B_GA0070898_100868 [Candidatus Kentron sp. H]VFK02129.1 MAG: hypothetical protein BECKH772C_GA0070978_100828 [Candidatus Kentron sp. H]